MILSPADESVGGPVTDVGQFDAPNAPTWVKLVAVNGNLFTLQREDGSRVTFDLDTHSFR